MKILRAIREYVGGCEEAPRYIVTFAEESGVVIADCSFRSKVDAEFVVNAVNSVYDMAGGKHEHCMEW